MRLLIGLLALIVSILPLPAFAEAPPTGSDVVLAGIYSDQWESRADLDALAAAAGKRVSIAGSFHLTTESVYVTDWILEQAWQAQATPLANISIDASAASIASGAYDDAIGKWAGQVKAWLDRGGGRSLLVAPLQEMNGDWTAYGMDPAGFRQAYGRFRAVFEGLGIDERSVRWVFAPNGWSTPPHRIVDYYPGAAEVDLIGVSTYNFGTTIADWTSVYATVVGAIEELRSFAPEKPYLLTQVGSSTHGGDRDAWLRDLFAYAASDPNLVGFLYFNIDSETDWRVWDGTTVADGWRDGMAMATTRHEFPLEEWFQPGPIPFSPSASSGRFVDDDASPFQAEIEWLAGRGITLGCNPPSNDRYCPDSPVTREQMASFLVRALDLPSSAIDHFSDDDDSVHEADIDAIAAAGISLGCGDGGYCPGENVSRQEMASFLVRALDLPASGGDPFTDDDGSLHEDDIEALEQAGITTGCTPTTFCPFGAVTREQMAAFLFRALG